MGEEVWEKVWTKNLIVSDYSLKYLDFMQGVEQALPQGTTVLEAGCGTGQTLFPLSKRHETVGLDISRAALNLPVPIVKTRCSGAFLKSHLRTIPLI